MTTMGTQATTYGQPEFVDINNLNLSSEASLGDNFDPDAELYTQPAPVPDGTYIARLRQSEDDPAKQWYAKKDRQGNTYYVTQLSAQISDTQSEFNGRLVFDNFVSTMVFENSGTSKVAAIIRAVGGFDEELRQVRTHEQLAQLFTRALASEPTCKIGTRWDVYDKDAPKDENDPSKGKGTSVLKGMRNFPQDANGVYQHIITSDFSGEELTARATPSRYLPIS